MNPPDPAPASPSSAAARRAILVVDDDLATLRMLGDALAAEGYAVLAARDADEALERFDLAVPDGVLLDAVMPGTDGFTLCARIKATPPWSHVPIVFMTGLSETEQIVRGFAAGGVDYVVKPLRLPEVLARLATHVANARAARLARPGGDQGSRRREGAQSGNGQGPEIGQRRGRMPVQEGQRDGHGGAAGEQGRKPGGLRGRGHRMGGTRKRAESVAKKGERGRRWRAADHRAPGGSCRAGPAGCAAHGTIPPCTHCLKKPASSWPAASCPKRKARPRSSSNRASG
ncbi:response regulator [Paracidovorax avenae]|uniref:response regulator n=1 Tax=Paracidovorax avenae TaxID=80867 RepID=UPI001CEF9534|nr:response regulator [Paracidovorax avenae]